MTELVRDYDRQPAARGRDLRELLERDRPQFVNDAVEELRDNRDSPGHAYLLRMIGADPLTLETVVDPNRLSEPQALDLARRIHRVDANVDVRLIRLLLDEAGSSRARDASRACRVLDIASRLSHGNRILALLTNLIREHQDARVRSKATLLMGRIHGTAEWAERRLSDADPRVRANAVESLWASAFECRPVLLASAGDPDHRVAANAAVGLHRAGDLACVPKLRSMMLHEDRAVRAASTWAMGETADPRFLTALERAASEAAGPVRQNGLRALVRVRERLARLLALPPLRVAAHWEDDNLRVSAHSARGEPAERLPATAFVVTHREMELEVAAVRHESHAPRPTYSIRLRSPGRPSVTVAAYAAEGKGEGRSG